MFFNLCQRVYTREIAVGHGSSAFLEFQKEGKREKLRNFRFERESRRIKILYVNKYMYNIIVFYSCYLIGNFLKNKHECKGLKGNRDEKLKVELLLLFSVEMKRKRREKKINEERKLEKTM